MNTARLFFPFRQSPVAAVFAQNELYRFPHVLVCLYDRAGCGYADGTLTGCVSTALQFSYAQYGNYLIESATSEVRQYCRALPLLLLCYYCRLNLFAEWSDQISASRAICPCDIAVRFVCNSLMLPGS